MVDIFNSTQANNRNFLVDSNLWLMIFFFTHSSAGEPLRGVGLVTGGGTEHLLITAGYMFLIRVPNSRSDTLITITFNSSTPHLSSRFRELSAEWVIYLFPWICGWDLPPGLWGSSILCLPSPPKIRSSSKFRGRGEESNLCSSKPFPIPSYTL